MALIDIKIGNVSRLGGESTLYSDKSVYKNNEINMDFVSEIFDFMYEQLSPDVSNIDYVEYYHNFEINPQDSNTKITSDELYDIIKNAEPSLLDKENFYVIFRSNKYRLVDESKLRDYLSRNPIDKRNYDDPDYVCHHYSWDLYHAVKIWDCSLAFGKASGDVSNSDIDHAWNFFINESKQLKYIEPQSDSIFRYDEYNAGLGYYDIVTFVA